MGRRNTNDAILAKLDKLIEQVKLTNALLAGPIITNYKKLWLDYHWQIVKKDEEEMLKLIVDSVFASIKEEVRE